MHYRKEIDGLRAIAVLPVIFYHAGFAAFSGGFVGVDVFFVISGFLITGLIHEELAGGSFSLQAFYERRARRILPALFLVLLCCLPFAFLWLFPVQLRTFFSAVLATLFFVSNILFWRQSDYFSADTQLDPLIHTWSLAVEEQYYLFFPLFLMGLWRLGASRVLPVLALLLLASFSRMLLSMDAAPVATFYLLPSRLWELMLGAILSVVLLRYPGIVKISALLRELLAATGLLLIAVAIVVLDDKTLFPSTNALLPTIGAALVLGFAGSDLFIGKMLGSKLLSGIGLLSYSAYLWHQPLFAFARVRSLQRPSELMFLALIALTFVLAFLTWKYVENRFRNRQRVFSRSFLLQTTGIALVLLFAGWLGMQTKANDYDFTVAAKLFARHDLDNRMLANYGLSANCDFGFTLAPMCRTDEKPELLVWGDSYAMHLIKGILADNPAAKLIQMTKSACGPALGLAPLGDTYTQDWVEECLNFNERVSRWATDNSGIRYAVLASSFASYVDPAWQVSDHEGNARQDPQAVAEAFIASLRYLEAAGIQPVIVAPPPNTIKNTGTCLQKSTVYEASLELCDIQLKQYHAASKAVLELLDKLAQEFTVIRFDEVLCDEVKCKAAKDDVLLYRDSGHLSIEGSVYLGKTMGLYDRITKPR